ncbi:MAG: phosphonoacetaldehyde dehydrogenase [SAR324 cluster bacterium]|jgi:putative phosphonoacetaldehyde dehydrogenase|nr:phosphonoacetaldehyde dehydrogenase [SAR324 cluster bacterium]|tara:strand:+ start:1497 stop:2921 length:1425 start_codon:yes stop_codon:yes gene_type:complete
MIEETMRVGGKKMEGENGSIDVLNPFNGEKVGTVPRASKNQVDQAMEIAKNFQPKLTRYERQQILSKTAELLVSRRDEISDLITAESGLSKKDSLYEVGRAFDVFSLTGQLCILDDGQIFSCDLTPHGQKRKIFTQREPLQGVISAITPFNHPLNMVAHKIAPSIATNNRMVCKPTEKTPLTALLLADVLVEAGMPPEMFQVVTGLPEDVGDAMITHPHIDLVTFTGSVGVGKYIAEKAGYRRTVLELGGNAPLIIMEDADLERASRLAVAGATKNSGQRCTAVKRILVEEPVADALVEKIVQKASNLQCGDPSDPQTDVGTVIDEASAILFERRVKDAVSLGAKKLYGKQRNGALFPPTVVDHVPWDCELVKEETFGPAIPIIRVKNIDDAIRIANGTNFGLSSGVCTNRFDDITRFISELNHGTVNIWEVPGYRIEMSPFGGIKDSGLGYKEGVIEAMKSFTNLKTFSMPWM